MHTGMSRVMRLICALLMLCTAAPPSEGANTHNVPTMQQEMQAWFGDAMSPYIVPGCAPTVPSPTSLTFAPFACTGYVRGSDGALVYVTQAAAAVGPLNAGNGTYWLALHRDTTTAVGGWTRQAGTHYLWQLNATEPGAPSGGLIVEQVTVAGGAITAVLSVKPSRPLSLASMTGQAMLYVGDYGTICDGTGDASVGINYAIKKMTTRENGLTYWGSQIILPAGICRITAPINGYRGMTLQGAGPEGTIILNAATTPAIDIDETPVDYESGVVTLRNLRIVGVGGTSGTAVHIKNVSLTHLEHVHIGDGSVASAPLTGVTIEGATAFSIYFYGVYINGTRQNGIEFLTSPTTRANFSLINTTVRNADINKTSTYYNLKLDSISGFTCISCVIENDVNSQVAGLVDEELSVNSSVFIGSHFEDRQTVRKPAILLKSSAGFFAAANFVDGPSNFLTTSGSGIDHGVVMANRGIGLASSSIVSTLFSDSLFLGNNVFNTGTSFALPRNIWVLDANVFRGFVTTPSSAGGIQLFTDGTGGILLGSESITNLKNISQTATEAKNIRGTVTLGGVSPTVVTLPVAEPDANYFVQVTCRGNEGAVWVTNQLASGVSFQINTTGVHTSVCAWLLYR